MKAISFVLIVAIGVSSCTQNITTPVEVDNHEQQLVVNGFVAMIDQEIPMAAVQVSKTKKLSQAGSPEIVSNATVQINTVNLPFDAAFGWNALPSPLNAAPSYNLTVNANGKQVQATDVLPSFTPITTAGFTGATKKITRYAGDDNEYYEFKITFTDPPQTGDHYQLLLSTTDSNWVASGFAFGPPQYYFDFACNDLSVYDDQLTQEDPFSSSGYNFIPSDMVIFQDKHFNGQSKELTLYIDKYFLMNHSYQFPDTFDHFEENLYIGLHHMSKASFQHYKDVKTQEMNRDNPFAEPTLVGGNITGALGFFGCRSIATRKIKTPVK